MFIGGIVETIPSHFCGLLLFFPHSYTPFGWIGSTMKRYVLSNDQVLEVFSWFWTVGQLGIAGDIDLAGPVMPRNDTQRMAKGKAILPG